MANWWDAVEGNQKLTAVHNDEALSKRFAKAREDSGPMSRWERFTNSYLDNALRSNVFGGAEQWMRAYQKLINGHSDEEINLAEKIFRRKLEARRNVDALYSDQKTTGRKVDDVASDVLGALGGGMDLTAVVAPGKTVLQRIGAQGLINAGVDVANQSIEKKRGLIDEYDPRQTLIAGAAGGLFQGAGEGFSKLRGLRMVSKGGRRPEFGGVVNTILDLEGGGTYSNPKTSPKGALGPMQVMPTTARDPGFGIRPWNGKTQEDLARVGRQYAAALTEKYDGDLQKVLAAYNGGHGRVDGLIKRFGDDWLRHMPEESRNYVRKGLNKLSGAVEDAPGRQAEIGIELTTPEQRAEIDGMTPEQRQGLQEIVDQSLYHGTNADVTGNILRVDPEATASLGTGVYLTPDKELASSYGKNLHEVGINSKDIFDFNKGFSVDDAYKTISDLGIDPKSFDDWKAGQNINNLKYEVEDDGLIPGYILHNDLSNFLGRETRNITDGSNQINRVLKEKGFKGVSGDVYGRPVTAMFDDVRLNIPNRDVPPSRPPFPNEKGFPKPGEPGNMGGPYGGADTPNDTGSIFDKMRTHLDNAADLRPQQEELIKQNRARQAEGIRKAGASTSGEDRLFAMRGAAKGASEKVDFEPLRNTLSKDEVNSLYDHVANFEGWKDTFEPMNALGGLQKLMDGQLPNNSELALLNNVLPQEVMASIVRKMPRSKWEEVADVLNIPRSVMSSFDISAPGRQGVMMIGRKEFWKNMPDMIKKFGSEKFYKASQEEIKARPTFKLMREAKLAVDDFQGAVTTKEESFQSPLAERIIPGVRASDRAYSGYLHQLRADVFDSIVTKHQELGIDVEDPRYLKSLGSYINTFTGRGDIHKSLQGAAPMLNAMFFSPRLISSRFNALLNPVFYAKMHPAVRKEAFMDLGKFYGVAASLLGLAAQVPGVEVSTDPTSSDFAKIKVGNTNYDILGGFQQYMVLVSRMAKRAGIAMGFAEPEKGLKLENLKNAPGRFARTKLSPLAAYAVDMWQGKDVVGKDFNFLWDTLGLFSPMAMGDLAQGLYEEGPVGAAKNLPGQIGVGVGPSKDSPERMNKDKKKKDEWWSEVEPASSKDEWWSEVEPENTKSEKNWWEQ